MAQRTEESVTKQERVYRAIRERILSGAYGPGYRVVIDALATEFGVSALPVREAIRRLEAEGLVIFRPNAGAHVAPRSEERRVGKECRSRLSPDHEQKNELQALEPARLTV